MLLAKSILQMQPRRSVVQPVMTEDSSSPQDWLGSTPMLNLEDDKLRLRVQTVLQFSRTDAEKLRAIAFYVSSIPFNIPALAGMKRTRTTLSRRRAVGWYSKAALFMAMLRVAKFPARVRMIRVPPELFRGLTTTHQKVALPVVEVHAHGRWVRTDCYLYDPLYLAVAREQLQRQGWTLGYGIDAQGQSLWNGVDDTLMMQPAELLGVYDDPQGYAVELRSRNPLRWLYLLARNRLLSIRMNHQVRKLRREAGG